MGKVQTMTPMSVPKVGRVWGGGGPKGSDYDTNVRSENKARLPYKGQFPSSLPGVVYHINSPPYICG